MRSVASESVQTAPMSGRASPWSPTSSVSGRSLFAPADGRFAPAPPARPSRPLGGFVPYAGHCIVPVKTNGLVRLPSFVRRNVSSEGPSIFLGLHAAQNCLVGSSVRWWQQLTMRCDSHSFNGADPAERRDIPPPPAPSRRLFGFCEEFWRPNEFVKLPSWARAVAGIANAALFVGAGETFEIWSIEDAMKSDDPDLVALVHSATKLQ